MSVRLDLIEILLTEPCLTLLVTLIKPSKIYLSILHSTFCTDELNAQTDPSNIILNEIFASTLLFDTV